MRAWWAYWLSLAVGAAVWLGAIVALGRDAFRVALSDPVPATILAAPILAAGVNLIAYRRTHETVCRLEAERHAWLRAVVGRGYSAGTFALTGFVLLALGAFVVVAAIAG